MSLGLTGWCQRERGSWSVSAGTLVLWLALFACAEPASGAATVGMGFTADGYPQLGAASAPIVLEEWSDYACPYCALHFRQISSALIETYVREGKVRIVFRDFPLVSLHPTSPIAHTAARCVGEQGADKYWAMHDALFTHQQEWVRLPDPSSQLARLAAGVGADQVAYETCLAAGRTSANVSKSLAEGESNGIGSTPSFRFSGPNDTRHAMSGAQPLARFETVIEALLDGRSPPDEPKPSPPELPYWASPAGLAPDPQWPGTNLAGDAFKGSPEAPVAVVEFTDFQCPACAKHAKEVQPKIDAEFIRTGKVLWIRKHLPLRSHAQAAQAAVAAECAGEQGRFWEMGDRLYETVDEWATQAVEQELPRIAEGLGLDFEKFRRCFDGRKSLERVLADLYDAQGTIERTPTFVILKDGKTGSTAGPMPIEQFRQLLQPREGESKSGSADQ